MDFESNEISTNGHCLGNTLHVAVSIQYSRSFMFYGSDQISDFGFDLLFFFPRFVQFLLCVSFQIIISIPYKLK